MICRSRLQKETQRTAVRPQSTPSLSLSSKQQKQRPPCRSTVQACRPAIARMNNEEDMEMGGLLGAAALHAVGYLAVHFLFPGASPATMVLGMLKSPGAAAAAVGAMMKAPGAGGLVICRAAFEANPKLYFSILRKFGPAAAVAAYAACSKP